MKADQQQWVACSSSSQWPLVVEILIASLVVRELWTLSQLSYVTNHMRTTKWHNCVLASVFVKQSRPATIKKNIRLLINKQNVSVHKHAKFLKSCILSGTIVSLLHPPYTNPVALNEL